MTDGMAPTERIQKPGGDGSIGWGMSQGHSGTEVKRRRVALGVERRQNGRGSNGSRIGRDEKDLPRRTKEKRQLFGGLGGLGNLQGAAAEASKVLNGFLNPTQQAAPTTTSSAIPPPAATSPPATTQAKSTTTPAPVVVSSTSQSSPSPIPPVVPSTTSKPTPEQNVPPATTPPVVALPIITSTPPPVAITPGLEPTAPSFLVPVDVDSPNVLLPDTQFDSPLPVLPGLGEGVLPSTASKNVVPTSTTLSVNPSSTLIQIDQNSKPEDPTGMSPLSKRLLIGAGVIGFLIIMVVALFFFLRQRRGETFAMFIKRKSPRRRSRQSAEHDQHTENMYTEPPPKYTSEPDAYDYAAAEKNVPVQRQMDSFYKPGPLPALSIPTRAAMPAFISPQRHVVSPLTPDDLTRTANNTQRIQSQGLYSVSPQSAKAPVPKANQVLGQNLVYRPTPTSAYSNNFGPINYGNSPSTQLNEGTFNSYSNAGTQNTYLTSQTSNLDNPSQQGNNRASTLSSLSSGFGDGLIVQDADTYRYTTRQPSQRKSKGQRSTRFSWQTTTSKPPGSDRTSTYTTTSVDTAPRFRTVNSWVAQQSGRVERQAMMEAQIPAMPPIPGPLQRSVAPIRHQRQESDISAFNYHPGQEIRLAPGSRVASSVLDKKIGHISRSTLG